MGLAGGLATNGQSGGGGGGAVKLSAAVADGATDNSATVQAELDSISAAGGGILQLPLGTVKFATRTTRAHSGWIGAVGALLHIPNNCQLRGGGATEGTKIFLDDTKLSAGDAGIHVYSAGGGRLNHDAIASCYLSSVTPTGSTFATSTVAPSLPWAVFMDRMHMSDVWIEGHWRASIASVGDHNYLRRCTLGGYASIELPLNYVSIGDLDLVECVFQGLYCCVLLPGIAGTNRAIQGWTFKRCHFGGGGGPIIYCPASVSNQTLILKSRWLACSWEGFGRGFVVDPSKLGAVTYAHLEDLNSNTAFYAGAAWPTDGPMPQGAIMQCGAITGLMLTANWQPVLVSGFDPTSACLIDCTTMNDCDLGDITVAITGALATGVPLLKCSGNVRNVVGCWSDPVNGAVKFRAMKATTAISRGDLVRNLQTGTNDQAHRFDSAGVTPGGVAIMPAYNGGVVLCAHALGGVPANITRTGRASLTGSLNPGALPTVSGTCNLTADLNLGQGGAHPRTIESYVAGQTTLRASAGIGRLSAAATLPQATLTLDDTSGMPASGTVVLNGGQTVTYTGTTQTTLTGCAGGSGTLPVGSFVTNLSDFPSSGLFSLGSVVVSYTGISVDATTGALLFTGIPASGAGSITTGSGAVAGTVLGRVASVDSNATMSASGAAKSGTTYFRYAGKSGTTYLYGVCSAVTAATTITSASALTEVNTAALTGLAENYKQTKGSAVLGGGAFPQLAYGAIINNALNTTAGTASCLMVDMTSTAASAVINSGSYVGGGTRLNGATTNAAVTITVYDTTGFPSSGTLFVGGTTVSYTGTTATTFTGCSGVTVIADDSAVTIKPALVVTGAEKFVRARYASGATGTDDQGLVTLASSHVDSSGVPIGFALGADTGASVIVRMLLPH